MTISSRWSAESPRIREWGQELPPEIQPCVGPVIDKSTGHLGHIEATTLELARSPKAKNVDPGCPPEIQPCVRPVFALALCIQLSRSRW